MSRATHGIYHITYVIVDYLDFSWHNAYAYTLFGGAQVTSAHLAPCASRKSRFFPHSRCCNHFHFPAHQRFTLRQSRGVPKGVNLFDVLLVIQSGLWDWDIRDYYSVNIRGTGATDSNKDSGTYSYVVH